MGWYHKLEKAICIRGSDLDSFLVCRLEMVCRNVCMITGHFMEIHLLAASILLKFSLNDYISFELPADKTFTWLEPRIQGHCLIPSAT